jgi:predicted MPP superfamily phosphohydrolase
MFGSILIVAFTALLAYVLWRIGSVPPIARRRSRKGLVALGAILWALFVVAQVVSHRAAGPVAAALEWLGMALLGSVFLVSTALLAVDVATLFGRALPRWAPTLRGWGMVAGAVLSGVALIQGLRAPAVTSYDVILPSLPAALDGTVLVAVSDAHLGTQLGEAWFADRVAQVKALRPDTVVFLGDMFEGHGAAPPELPALGTLDAPLGKWFVDGNHESHGVAGAGNDLLERGGFRRLANRSVVLAPGLVLAGVDDLTSHQRRGLDGDPLARALTDRPAGATVLLSHTPLKADRAQASGVELMLSGHTHGGQLWPFGYLVARVHPLLAGLHLVAGMPVIVSRGTGTWGPRMRLWHRSEIVRVTLHAAKRDGPVPSGAGPTGAHRLCIYCGS